MTALIVKVISMIAERQQMVVGQQGRTARVVPLSEIRHSVGYLLSVQKGDGSFGDPRPVLHRDVMVIMTVYIKCIQAIQSSNVCSCCDSIVFVCLITGRRGPQSFPDGFYNNCTLPINSYAGQPKSRSGEIFFILF